MYQVGNVKGQLTDPDNRCARILRDWDEITGKLERSIEAGYGETEHARLAYAALMIMETGIRPGNEESAEGRVSVNKYSPNFGLPVQTFGVTTLQRRHVQVGESLTLDFIGKKAVQQNLSTKNPTLIKYAPPVDDTEQSWLGIDYPSLFKFVEKHIGFMYTPKDLRRAKVNQIFLDYLESELNKPTKKDIRNMIKATAEEIGHTPAVCKRSYISGFLLFSLEAK
jgi:DNA topoisomerase IB